MDEPSTEEELLEFLRDQYETTKQPHHLITAFLMLTSDDQKGAVVPSWIYNALCTNFAEFLQRDHTGEKVSLDGIMGFGSNKLKIVPDDDGLILQIHIYRKLFDLKASDAVRAVSIKYESKIKVRGLAEKRQGLTKNRESLKQMYDRSSKKGYPAFLKLNEGADVFNNANRDEALSLMDDATVTFVKRWSPFYKKR